jgi:hypothetical protein
VLLQRRELRPHRRPLAPLRLRPPRVARRLDPVRRRLPELRPHRRLQAPGPRVSSLARQPQRRRPTRRNTPRRRLLRPSGPRRRSRRHCRRRHSRGARI